MSSRKIIIFSALAMSAGVAGASADGNPNKFGQQIETYRTMTLSEAESLLNDKSATVSMLKPSNAAENLVLAYEGAAPCNGSAAVCM